MVSLTDLWVSRVRASPLCAVFEHLGGDWRVKRTHFGVEMGPTWGWFDHVG